MSPDVEPAAPHSFPAVAFRFRFTPSWWMKLSAPPLSSLSWASRTVSSGGAHSADHVRMRTIPAAVGERAAPDNVPSCLLSSSVCRARMISPSRPSCRGRGTRFHVIGVFCTSTPARIVGMVLCHAGTIRVRPAVDVLRERRGLTPSPTPARGSSPSNHARCRGP